MQTVPLDDERAGRSNESERREQMREWARGAWRARPRRRLAFFCAPRSCAIEKAEFVKLRQLKAAAAAAASATLSKRAYQRRSSKVFKIDARRFRVYRRRFGARGARVLMLVVKTLAEYG